VIPSFSYNVGHTFRLPVALRVIPRRSFWRLQDRFSQWVHARMMLRDLNEVESQLEINSQTVVLVPTVYANQILPFVYWAEQLPRDRRPRFALVFHSSAYPNFTDPEHLERLYRHGFRRMERSEARHNFHLFTDAEDLVDEFQSYTTLPVNQLPIPHSGGNTCETEFDHDRDRGRRPLRIAYLGDSTRLNKGFDLFAPLFHRLRGHLESGRIVAELQASVGDSAWPQIRTGIRRLRAMPGVTLHERSMASEEYYDLLARSHFVVLPYTTETYHSQTSGVFSEAVAHGKPVVVPRGTWMARQLRDRAAGVTFIPRDPQSLYESVLEAIERYDELSECAIERSGAWRKQHCVPAYLDKVFKTIGVG
jgi:glycosyltransferase involved in cell wall biosynthesis